MDITQLKPIDLSLAQDKPPLVAVSPTISIESALTLLHKHKFTSLPIFSHDSAKVVSIVNLFDILLYLAENQATVHKEEFPLHHPIENVLGLDSDRESYRMNKTDRNDKLLDTLRIFASGGHRSLVVDETDESKHPWILSQTDIIRHIVNHPDCIHDLVNINATLQELGLLNKSRNDLVVADQNETTLNVYRLMAREKLSSVPILNDQDKFLGVLSLENLPGASLETIELLDLPISDYLKTSTNHHSITNDKNATLKDILDSMVKNDTHRVWILDDGNIVGVVTMSDIIGLLCSKHSSSIF
ncbi:hypothetical protein BJ944DRAFT_174850 [Cunninghamella echinulata]|nr:hypothetical protein BJ944DRAFT_174850 [Cunninghamella echinulata]